MPLITKNIDVKTLLTIGMVLCIVGPSKKVNNEVIQEHRNTMTLNLKTINTTIQTSSLNFLVTDLLKFESERFRQPLETEASVLANPIKGFQIGPRYSRRFNRRS